MPAADDYMRNGNWERSDESASGQHQQKCTDEVESASAQMALTSVEAVKSSTS